MNFKTIVGVTLLVMVTAFSASAQDKIGYANIELMLAYMPETKTMSESLQTYQAQLAQQMQTKEIYAQQKLQEFQEYAQQNPNASPDNDSKLKGMQDELVKLDNELRQFAADSEQNLLLKQQTLLEPISNKLQAAIKKIANEQGYTFIFNSVDGSGVSIILEGPEEKDLTRTILSALGVSIPEN